MAADQPERVPNTDRWWAGPLVYASLGILLVILLIFRETDSATSIEHTGKLPFTDFVYLPQFADAFYGLIAGITGLGLLVHAWIGKPLLGTRRWYRPLTRSGLIVLVLLCGFNWVYGTHGIAKRHYNKHYELYHYLLGPKYYAELGYFGLYECTVLADAESLRWLKGRKMRDLESFDYVKVSTVPKDARCRQNFSEERWAEFVHDYQEIAKPATRGVMHAAIRDLGYNGTPFHAWLAGGLANSFDLDYRSMIWGSLIDTLGMLALFAGLSVVFGFEIVAIMAIVFFTAFYDRFVQIGGSFFRYHFMILTGLGLIAIHRGRHGWGGIAIALAAMLNVFPVLFVLGIGGKGAIEWIRDLREKFRTHSPSWPRPRPEVIRFTLACMGTAAVCFILSLGLAGGIETWRDFLADMSKHSKLVTIMRIGFRYLFLWRGETRPDEFSNSVRTAEMEVLETWVMVLALLGLGVVISMLPRMSDVQATISAGFATFYFMLGTVQYYFGVFAFCTLLFVSTRGSRSTQTVLALPLLLAPAVYYVWYFYEYKGFCNNYMMSSLIMISLSGMLIELDRSLPDRTRLGSRFVVAGVVTLWIGALLSTLIRW